MGEVSITQSGRARQRNARGEGHLLRADILAAASEILERTGTEEAVTLRGVAQQVGISAPSIYHHFADRAAIIDAVVAEDIGALAEQLTAGADGGAGDPIDALVGAWTAYADFGRDNPGKYRVIFERRFLAVWDGRIMTDTAPIFDQTVQMMIGLLQACIDAGCSTSTDALTDSVAIWYYAHGTVALPTTITSFPWPDRDSQLTAGIHNLGHLRRRPRTRRAR